MILTSTFQGLPNLLRTERLFFKIIWLLTLVASFSICIYYQITTVIDYFEYEVVTTITTINEANQEYPAITLCDSVNKSFELNFTHLYFNFNDWKDEWKNYFEVYNDTYYGRCFRFNSGLSYNGTKVDILKSSGVSRTYGLDFGLYLDTGYEINSPILYFHNYTFKPTTIFGLEYYFSMGSYHNFVIDRVVNKKLGEPYNDCLKDMNEFKKNKTIINYFNRTNQQYSQEICFSLCQGIFFNQSSKCSCKLDSLDDSIYLKCIENNMDDSASNCTRRFMIEFNKKNPLELCDAYCPSECDSVSLNIVSNSYFFPKTGNISKNSNDTWLNNFDTYESLSRSFIAFNVYYKDLKYTFISQQAKTKVFDLISNMGGLFGLFLGMGLLSFVELLEIILENIILIFNGS